MGLAITKLLQLIDEMPAYRRLVDEICQANDNVKAAILDAAKSYLIAALYHSLKKPILVVTAQPENGKKLYEQLSAWRPSPWIKLFPEPDTLPYQRVASDTATELERLQVLSALTNTESNKDALLVVASAPAFMQKTTSHSDFASTSHIVKAGMETEPLELLSRWQAMGYEVESVAEVPGTISRRGGIIDVYPPSSELPARLEFYGNIIDSIRLFDPINQRSLKTVPEVAISPATERITSLSDSILDYLPSDALIILDEPPNLKSAIEELDAKAEELRTEKVERGELPPDSPKPYFIWEELESEIKTRQYLALAGWDTGEDQHRLDFSPTPSYAGQLPTFIKKVKELLNQKHRLILTSHQAARISELFDEEGIIAPPLTEIKQIPPPGSLTLIQGSLAEGWVMNTHTHLFTDYEIFGFLKQRRLTRKRPVSRQKLLVELAPGDYVVHIEHGIAKFAGVITMSTDSTKKEYLVLHYAAGDKLYVPTDQMDRINRYIGASDHPPVLSRLGTQEWTRTKQRAKEAAEEVAQGLLALYATREVVPGFAFATDTVWQQELEASFPYIETPDQMKTQQQVKADMEKAKPMDRLACGDVGYGKTEVAIRAAFKAVMDGKQVAVLVPTTVLAEQHFATFSQRLGAFPVRIEVLSRFRTPKEQQDIIEGLANGRVDICIGTHRLLQKDVAFKDLGLLIIDEEQRFGVAHKEYLKKMRREVDVLTLSATPIPRTLYMSLVGVRDMSTMETPPEDRLPIKTYVAQYDDRLIREVIIRELERNGQVFFVHNRVRSIAFIAGKLQSLVPEARIATAHGQMPEAELERVMTDFTQGKTDILVCTTIIESGLDMPNVNTLIVNHADKFGLTQLYQLRGRIGRGANLAYAYFLYEKGKQLTPTAEKRLKTIFQATELGAGFNIALKDLEIRGAGSLLGVKQSGHITAVGFSLYCRLLADAVEEHKTGRAGIAQKAVRPAHLPPPTIDLPLPAYIPEEYASDLNTRLSLYQRLANMNAVDEIEALANELSDRFGALPPEARNLLYALRIKILAAEAAIESIDTEDNQIIIRRFKGMHFNRQQLEPLARDGIKIGLTQLSLNHKRLGKEWRKVLEEVLKKTIQSNE